MSNSQNQVVERHLNPIIYSKRFKSYFALQSDVIFTFLKLKVCLTIFIDRRQSQNSFYSYKYLNTLSSLSLKFENINRTQSNGRHHHLTYGAEYQITNF